MRARRSQRCPAATSGSDCSSSCTRCRTSRRQWRARRGEAWQSTKAASSSPGGQTRAEPPLAARALRGAASWLAPVRRPEIGRVLFFSYYVHKKNKRPYGERPEITPPPLRAFHRSFGSHAYRISSTMRGFAVLVLAAAVSGSPLQAQPQAQRRRRFGSRPVAASAAWVAPSTPARASRVSAWTRAAASPQQQRICTADVRMEADLYTVLGVPRSASDRDIKNVRRCPPLQSPRHGRVLCTVVQTQRSLGWTRRCGSSGARWRVLTSSAPLLRAAPPTRLLSHVKTRGLAVLYPHPPSCPRLTFQQIVPLKKQTLAPLILFRSSSLPRRTVRMLASTTPT